MYIPSEIPAVSARTRKKLRIDRFDGIDCSGDPYNISATYSPDEKNLLPSAGGKIESRSGMSCIYAGSARINGVHLWVRGTAVRRLIHEGVKLMFNTTVLASDMANALSTSVQIGTKLIILDGRRVRVYDGSTLSFLDEAAYVPTTSIGRSPSGDTATPYESANMISDYRINTFVTTAATDTFYVADGEINTTDFQVWTIVNGVWTQHTGTWTATASTTGMAMFKLSGTTIPASPVPGRDNVKIKYKMARNTSKALINACRTAFTYGIAGKNDALFVTGNANMPNYDWHTEPNMDSTEADMTYFPDTGYTMLGSNASEIIGYSRMGDGTLATHKSVSWSEPVVYYRTGELREINGELHHTYPVTNGSPGAAAVSRWAQANVLNDPIFLSKSGVYTIRPVNNSAVNERFAQLISEQINGMIAAAPATSLAEAYGIEYDGKYWLAVAGNIYVYDPATGGWWYLPGMKVRVLFKQSTFIGFGDTTGGVYVFNNTSTDDGTPFEVYWTTPELDLGDIQRYKTIERVGVVIGDCPKCDVTVEVIADGEVKATKTLRDPGVLEIRTRIRRVRTCQIRISTDSASKIKITAIEVVYSDGGEIK